jgi:hypothetical protein
MVKSCRIRTLLTTNIDDLEYFKSFNCSIQLHCSQSCSNPHASVQFISRFISS